MLLIDDIGLLQTAVGASPGCGGAQGENRKIKDAAILIENGRIAGIFADGEKPRVDCPVLFAGGRLATPGLVDCHTHMAFGGWRQHELPRKLAGATYLDILQAGGGILDTVRKTRALSIEELFQRSMGFLRESRSFGVTSLEVKSGYGLDTETELKQLRVIRRMGEESGITVIPTFLGAHAVPPEYAGRQAEYVELVVREMLPAVRREGLARYCDAFLETGVFSVEESFTILEAARSMGFGLKLHTDEIDAIGGSVLAGELRCTSAEHLIAVDAAGIAALKRGGTVAALLPMTSHYLGKAYAPARAFIEAGVPVAVASDFNPGSCPSLNMQLAISLACTKYRMQPEEVLTAVTRNAACALGIGEETGTLEVGKRADVVLWEAEDFDTLCYRFGSNLAYRVICGGTVQD